MATKGSNQKSRKANPMLTKTGKPRLGPLNLKQLNDMLGKSSRPKDEDKLKKEITQFHQTLHLVLLDMDLHI